MKLLVASLLCVALIAAPAQAKPEGRWHGPCSNWKMGENLTPSLWASDPSRGRSMMVRLVTCVFDHWAPGNTQHALYVAQRESNFYPWAQNPQSLCSGLFQHALALWPGRTQVFLWRGWFAKWTWDRDHDGEMERWSDPRANAIVAARMVELAGWGPWT